MCKLWFHDLWVSWSDMFWQLLYHMTRNTYRTYLTLLKPSHCSFRMRGINWSGFWMVPCPERGKTAERGEAAGWQVGRQKKCACCNLEEKDLCSFMHVIYELDKTVELKQEFELHLSRDMMKRNYSFLQLCKDN